MFQEKPQQLKAELAPEVSPPPQQDDVAAEEVRSESAPFVRLVRCSLSDLQSSGVSWMQATMKSMEKHYVDFLAEAAHHPQVLSIKADLKLEAAPKVYREMVRGDNN